MSMLRGSCGKTGVRHVPLPPGEGHRSHPAIPFEPPARRGWEHRRHYPPVGRLDKALDEAQTKGWTVVDMKNDWLTVFPSDGDTKP